MFTKATIYITLVLSLYLCLTADVMAAATNPQVPLTPHCIRSGPVVLPLDYCGCTWGYVYYRGQPIPAAPVALIFQNQITATVSSPSVVDPLAYYSLSGAPLGAKLDDRMTVTTTIAGQSVAQHFRARPDHEGEQAVPLVIPEQGEWQLFLTGGYTRTLVVQDQILWAGGPAGLLRVDLATGVQTMQTLPWAVGSVTALASGPQGVVWAAGDHHLAFYA